MLNLSLTTELPIVLFILESLAFYYDPLPRVSLTLFLRPVKALLRPYCTVDLLYSGAGGGRFRHGARESVNGLRHLSTCAFVWWKIRS